MDLGPIHSKEEEWHQLEDATQNLLQVIKDTEIYKAYKMQCSKLNKQLDVKARVDEYRQKNFELQNSELSGEQILAEQEKIGYEYADVLQNPLIQDFLASELEFCRMIQNINLQITDGLDFE